MLLINSSVKETNNTGQVIACLSHYCQLNKQPYTVSELPLFDSFTGTYVTALENLPFATAQFIREVESQQDHLYFVPTYYKSLPGVFKNYLDIVRMPSLHHNKRIGIVSANAENQDCGARQFMQSLAELLEFHQAVSVVIPQILILNPDDVDLQRFDDYLNYFLSFPVPDALRCSTGCQS